MTAVVPFRFLFHQHCFPPSLLSTKLCTCLWLSSATVRDLNFFILEFPVVFLLISLALITCSLATSHITLQSSISNDKEDSITMDVIEIRSEGVDWIDLAHDGDR